MATIRKRGDYQYQARIQRLGYPAQVRTFRTKEEAEVWAAEVELELKKGTFQCRKEAQTTTLADALRRYSREITPNKKGWREEERKINALIQEPFAQLTLTALSGRDLQRWSDEEVARGYAPNTVRLKLAIVSNLYTIARKRWDMGSLDNPVMAMQMPKVTNGREVRVLPHDEERLLAIADPVMQQIITLAIETGMRRSEILNLRWKDVHPLAIRLADTKNGQTRSVPLSIRARAVLAERGEPDRKVFNIHPDTASHLFQEYCQTIGLQGAVFHSLRHEAVSRFFERGLQMMEVMQISGHKTTSQLLRYSHLLVDNLAAKLG
jgi:integrase